MKAALDFKTVNECFDALDKAFKKSSVFRAFKFEANHFQLLWNESTPNELKFQHKITGFVIVFNWKLKRVRKDVSDE
jgi:hypothetical protein